jgi:hypothetical protein
MLRATLKSFRRPGKLVSEICALMMSTFFPQPVLVLCLAHLSLKYTLITSHRYGSFAYGPCLQFPEKFRFSGRKCNMDSYTLLGITVRNGT